MKARDANDIAREDGVDVLRATLDGARRSSGSTAKKALEFSAATLQAMRFEPINFVVPGYVVEGLTLLAGKPKKGKSWLCLDWAIAVARGGYTMGQAKCEEGDVLYAALEENERRLQRRMTKLLRLDAWPPRLSFRCSMPRLKEGGIGVIREWIKQAKRPRLVIIDTLAKVRAPKGREESTYEADYAAVGELKALADEHGIAIVLVHHLRKMDAEDPLDSVSGTTGLTGAVDTVIVLITGGAQGTKLYGRGRDLEEVDQAMQFDKETCRWRVLGEAGEVRRSNERGVILDVLRAAVAPMRPKEIAEASGGKQNNVKQLLTKMALDDEVIQLPDGRGYIHPSRTDLDPSRAR